MLAARRASRAFLASSHGQEFVRPEEIPAFTTRVSDLPPVFDPAEEIIQIVSERAAQILEHG
ncbi:hypothetical protein ACFWNT_41840 [Streptomyces sp. NPDC058409]|uniref:hypothetical protein n=1 Tax=Streptomyces sp. NPDC058409 TaxID=3346484 RepID=UPI00364EEE71